MNDKVKKILTLAGVIVFFLIVAYSTVPQVLGGKVSEQELPLLQQEDCPFERHLIN